MSIEALVNWDPDDLALEGHPIADNWANELRVRPDRRYVWPEVSVEEVVDLIRWRIFSEKTSARDCVRGPVRRAPRIGRGADQSPD